MRKFATIALAAGVLNLASAGEPLLVPVPAPTLESPPELRAETRPTLPAPIFNPPQAQVPLAPYNPAVPVEIPGVVPGPGMSRMTADPLLVEPGRIICDAKMGYGIPLYPRVRVEDPRRIHPLAVTKIVAVPDPTCDHGCVFIKICVPPCECENVICRRGKIRFDYGRFAVEVSQRRGVIHIDYDS